MPITCKDIINHFNKWAPPNLSIDKDNVGLLVGEHSQKLEKILVALDASFDVIQEAIDNQVDMIVTHHPMPFMPLKKINDNDVNSRKVIKLIKNNISLFVAHTNLDVAEGGTNTVLGELLGVKDTKSLKITKNQILKKIIVYIPIDHLEQVRVAMCKAGAGHIGNYSDCTHHAQVTGTFLPREGAMPYIGQQGKLQKVKEVKLETIVQTENLNKVIQAMKKVHPYEEIAYDIYPLELKGKEEGIGKVGILKQEKTLLEFANEIKQKLKLKHIKIAGNKESIIKKVAFCTGSGMSFINYALKEKADVYITGDVKFHDACDAIEKGINIIDATHYGTEKIIIPVIKKYIENYSNEIEIIESEVDGEPFDIV